jgi:hypothetical protein
MKDREVVFDSDLDFWATFPELKQVGSIKRFYEGNEKKDSSRLMWFIAFCYHPSSVAFSAEKNYKHITFSESILGDRDYYIKNKDFIDPLIEEFKKTIYSPPFRALNVWNEKMDERIQFLESTEYSADTAELLDKMLGTNLKNMFDSLERIMKEVGKEIASLALGGVKPSESDEGKM